MKSMSHSTPSDARKNDAPRNDASLPHVNAVTSGRNTLILSVQSMTMYASASGRRARGMLLRLPL